MTWASYLKQDFTVRAQMVRKLWESVGKLECQKQRFLKTSISTTQLISQTYQNQRKELFPQIPESSNE